MKTLSLILILLSALSCQKKNELRSLSWSQGDDPSALAEIQKIEARNDSPAILFHGEKTQFSKQTQGLSEIESSFVKRQFSSNNELSSAEASYAEPERLQSSASITPLTPELFLTQIRSHIAPLQMRSPVFQKIWFAHHGRFDLRTGVTYELPDGTLWRALFDMNNQLIQTKRLGSGVAADTRSRLFPKGPRLSVLTDVLLKNVDSAPLFSNINSLVDSESPLKINSISPQMQFDPKDERFDQMQTLYYLDLVQTWMKTNLGVEFPQKIEAVVNVGSPNKTNTAFYFQNKIRLGRGDNITYTMMASDPSIVYHESFHAVVDGLAHLPFEKEGGSLNEGFADFFACAALGRPFVGEASSVAAPYKRTLQTSIKLQEKNGGLYHDSQILSGLLWELKEKWGTSKSLRVTTMTLARLNPLSDFRDFNQNFLKIMKQELSADDVEMAKIILKERGFQYE